MPIDQKARDLRRSRSRKRLTVCLRIVCLIIVTGAIVKLLAFNEHQVSSPVIALAAMVVPQVVMPIVNLWFDIIWLREHRC